MAEYYEAAMKDINRLLSEVEAAKKVLKSKPNDAAAQKKVKDASPFLTKQSIQKRIDLALKQDQAALGKRLKGMGLPGW